MSKSWLYLAPQGPGVGGESKGFLLQGVGNRMTMPL